MAVCFVSYGTDPQQCKELYRSCKLHDIPPTIKGLNTPWNGFQDKLSAMLEYVLWVEKRHGRQQVVCFCDGYDVVVADTAESILAKYKSFEKPLVVSTEQFMHPDNTKRLCRLYEQRMPEPASKFCFVNSGTYIGSVAVIKRFLLWCKAYQFNCPSADGRSHLLADDQRALTTFCLRYPELCALDTKQVIFSCMAGCHFGKTLEVVGEPGHLDVAEHVYTVLLRTAEGAWAAHRRARGGRSSKGRSAFMEGGVLGGRGPHARCAARGGVGIVSVLHV